ncbi:MAG TPA: hypothetical protein VGQ26_19265 [Streptosporangiaceae bacterium]|jgi:hypothetical protein|nr:hypothetical protein [Streptosporangiaceae bacterium]
MTNADSPRRSLTVLTGATFLLASEFLAATAAAACMHPHISSLNSRERQRDMLAQADRQRRARQASELARASRRAEGIGRRQRHAEGIGRRQCRAWRTVAALIGLLPRYRTVR